jgi:sugar transferase (PEP-CTERM/EpsH1 system associated)
MKVLMLTPYLPYPLTSGGQIRSYNLLKKLAGRHEITLVAFIRDEAEREHLDHLAAFCRRIRTVKRRRAWSPLNILFAGVTPMPFLLAIYFSPAFRKTVQEELAGEDYDLIHSECFYLMHNLPKTKVPVLLVEQTIEYLVYQSVVENSPLWPLKPLLYLDVLKIKYWEKHYWRKVDRLVTMSAKDKEFIKREMPDKAIDVVANGVDTEFFDRVKRSPAKEPTVLFIGQFKWHPNIDAACFLVEKIWPLIREKVPGARLWIIGRNPTPQIEALKKSPEIEVREVEDIREVLGRAHVLLAPIRNGRGTKYKVLEAMASGLPVVTTPLGIEGIRAEAGSEVLVAKTARELAETTVRVLQNPPLGAAVARKAKKLVKKGYNWDLIAAELDRVYQEVGERGGFDPGRANLFRSGKVRRDG